MGEPRRSRITSRNVSTIGFKPLHCPLPYSDFVCVAVDFHGCFSNPYQYTINSDGTYPESYDYRGIGTQEGDRLYIFAHIILSTCFNEPSCA